MSIPTKNIFNLEHLLQSTICSLVKETDLIHSIKLISKNFTTHRNAISQYTMSSELVSAYSCFYLPTNALKLQFILQQLDPSILEIMAECQFIDIGCGPGTYFLAMLDQIINKSQQAFNGEIIAIDSSDLMLKQAEKNCHHFFGKKINISYQSTGVDDLAETDRPRVILMGNVVNEIESDLALSILKKVNADYIFIIDIGTPLFFEKMLVLRARLAEGSYHSLYPCFDISQKCPLEGPDMESSGWCHQILRTTNHPSIERLSQLVSINRKNMPFISHVYAKESIREKVATENCATFVRYISESKFSYIWESCVLINQKNTLLHFEILKKHLSKIEKKQMKKMSVGIRFIYTTDKIKKNGDQQVRLCSL